MPKVTINNSNVKILPSDEFLDFIKNVYDTEESQEDTKVSKSHINKVSSEKNRFIEKLETTSDNILKHSNGHFDLDDLHCLRKGFQRLRQNKKTNMYLYELLQKCTIVLPENEFIPRNERLEARCEKLKAAQANTAYKNITKNVNFTVKQNVEDTFAFQLKEVNRQIIAVVQFVFSVVAGFTFGFLGLELIVGNLDFGFRLLLGIMCALIIALAEIYFLAKKLNECDDVLIKKIKNE